MDNLTRASFIQKRATEALEKTGQSKPPTDLEAIARHYGLSVVRGPRKDGVLAHFDAARNEIVLGEFERWPLAHELGHALLRHSSRDCYQGAMASDAPLAEVELGLPYEAEANRFARCLLVPKLWIEFLLSRGWKHADLPSKFEVSEKVFWYALSGYGMI